ncbi:hypothetical protein E6B08_06130 [Pseudomonas putida]|uniref:Alpha-xenorhabdolysin family binary toxin subunit B n=1 Tax=Pseudomonas putida TaxID=303 RepID=A0A4D6X4M8_PSEPU|nr:alpha-xenorhabdolysin family binary toxin subunit B [Pseudomonas putida]QCI11013.1 hypothetical protein E6B08_06130 [Pseudomonas putida]
MDIKADDLPDMGSMLSIESRLNDLYHSKTVGMVPALRERLRDLKGLIQGGNDILRENVISGLVALNLDLEFSSTATEEDLLRSCQFLNEEMAQIAQAVERVTRYRSPPLTAVAEDNDQRIVSSRAAVERQEQLIAAQRKRLSEVDELLNTLDRPSVQKALRNLIPLEKDIDVMLSAFSDPTFSVGLVKAALEKLNQNLDLLEQGRRFSDVLDARGRLAAQLEEQKRLLQELQRHLQAAQARSGQLVGARELLALREPWLEQASKFTVHWQAVSSTIRGSTEPHDLVTALGEARDYLLALRRRIEAV